MNPLPRGVVGLLAGIALACTSLVAAAETLAVDPALAAAIGSSQRTPKFIARDAARHPAEELTFFGLKPDMTVAELWPSGGYWTEILAPYLASQGHYIAVLGVPSEDGEGANTKAWRAKLAEQGARYGKVTETRLGPGQFDIAPAGSVDLVLTFRNLHNWMDEGYVDAALAACFRALKPGGILGIEDHRARNDVPQDPKSASGYVRQDYAIALARKAGFEFAGSSEVNANVRDTKDWAEGVWTLPPSLTLGDKDRAKYLAIGEADNFVLKFRKPAPEAPRHRGRAVHARPHG
jgi:predicted methyltransferase